VGATLLLWFAGGIISLAASLVWLELGLSTPRLPVPGVGKRSVPRSGGEKNYVRHIHQPCSPSKADETKLEYIFPHLLTTCMYGIVFILLGNLAGNAIAFGLYVMSAAGDDNPSKSSVIGIAIAALTAVCLVHVASRRGGIALSNFFAVTKVLILVVIIILGIARGCGYTFGGSADPHTYPTHNFDLNKSFAGTSRNMPNFAHSLLFILYPLSSFKQPFYVSIGLRREDV